MPTPLEEIIEQLLEKEPEDRIATAQALSSRLKSMRFGLDSGASVERGSGRRPVDQNQTALPGPTAAGEVEADEDDYEVGDSRYWKETVVAQTDASNATSIPPSESPAPTVYTEVSEEAAKAVDDEEARTVDWSSRLSTVAVAATLVGLLALAWFLSRPPTPDALYSEIAAVTAQRKFDEFVNVRGDIDEFLERFPDDPRCEIVRNWREDHQWYKLWRRLERQVRRLGELELLEPCRELFVRAARSDNANDRSQAIAHYELLLRDCGAGDDREIAECLAAARHRLEQLHGAAPP